VRLLTSMSGVARALGIDRVTVALTDFDGGMSRVVSAVTAELGPGGIHVRVDRERAAGRGYYPSVCFKVFATGSEGEDIEIGDGGFVPWTQRLLSNAKERLLIGGLGIDRLAGSGDVSR